MTSKFLPPDFDINAPLCIIAGRGAYPQILAQSARNAGAKLYLIGFEGETETEFFESFAEEHRAIINVGQIGKLLKTLKAFGAKAAIMAGQITPKKLFKGMTPDLKAVMMLAALKVRNAETIFGAIANEMEKIGVPLLDARSFMDAHMAPKGFFSGSSWEITPNALEHGAHIARECARLDIGQGCVVSKGSVLAVEAFEGTDKMLERAGTFGAKDLLFVKTVKHNQDYRFDVPVVGERTILKMAESGVMNAALEADKVIILDAPAVKALAEKNNIKIYGI